jgi:hypothetical protein
MEHAHGGADAAAAAAAATVAPLLQLKRAARKAKKLSRFARAVELYERAIAAAELALPRDSLIIAALLHELGVMQYTAAQGNASSPAFAESMAVKLRLLRLLHARWQAGTLFTPTAEEVAYLVEDEYSGLPAQMCGAFFYVVAAGSAAELQQDLSPCASVAEAEARLHAEYGALRTVLEMDARGMLERNPCTGQAWPAARSMLVVCLEIAVHGFVTRALSDEAGLLLRMRAACGLTAAEETALRQLVDRYNKATAERRQQEWQGRMEDLNARQQQIAAADAARHGLRRCALPSCDAQEAHPKLFKLCSRCNATAYCCKQHQTEDWQRHKRADGCKAA